MSYWLCATDYRHGTGAKRRGCEWHKTVGIREFMHVSG